MGTLQTDLNAALYAVKQKCVDLDELVKNEDNKPENQSRGYLGVKRYIYALTTHEKKTHAKRGRSLTRVYMEQKYYRSRSAPSFDQVQRQEDCTQDYGPNGEQRLEFTETITAPLVELIKEDESHSKVVGGRLPSGHAAWDHELLVFEEDGASGRLEDRKLVLRAGDNIEGENDLTEVADHVAKKFSEFFGQVISAREIATPTFQELPKRSKSLSTLEMEQQEASQNLQATTTSLSDIFTVESKHRYDSKYGTYISGYGRYGRPAYTEHIYQTPTKIYDRKPTFARREVEMPQGYHSYYNPSQFMYTNTYYSGNLTRPLHYSYSQDRLEKYSDYDGSGRQSRNIIKEEIVQKPPTPVPEPVIIVEPVVVAPPKPEPVIVVEPVFVAPEPEFVHIKELELHRNHNEIVSEPFLMRTYPDYFDASSRIVLKKAEELSHEPLEVEQVYEVQEIIATFDDEPVYEDVPIEEPIYEEVPAQKIIEEEPIYELPYEEPPRVLKRSSDVGFIEYRPEVPELPPPPPPPVEIFVPAPSPPVAPPVEIIEHAPTPPLAPPIDISSRSPTPPPTYDELPPSPPPSPAIRHHLNDIYVGQDALSISVSPTFGVSEDQKHLGLEKSVLDRVREMEQAARDKENEKEREWHEKKLRYEELQNEIRDSRPVETYDAYAHDDRAVPTSPVKSRLNKRKAPKRKNTPAPPPPVPEKPRRTWVPPPKLEEEIDIKDDKPLGPIIFHELMYNNSYLQKIYQEEHSLQNARPVSRPVSRAISRPSTPGFEVKTIDFPRQDHISSHDSVEFGDIHERIERYNAYGDDYSHSHIEKAPSPDVIYDTPHDTRLNHYEHIGSDEVGPHQHSISHQEIRQMSKNNNWDSHASKSVSSSLTTSTTTTTTHNVVRQSSLKRDNVPPPLVFNNSDAGHHHQHHHHHHHHHHEHEHHQVPPVEHHQEEVVSVNVGHVKNLSKLFNKPDEKPISTEQVIYRERVVPHGYVPSHQAPAPRSLRRIPLDEVELAHDPHAHSHHHHAHIITTRVHEEINGNVVKDVDYTHSDQPIVKVRKVYRAVIDGDNETSILSPPLSQPENDEPLYDVPTDAT